MPAGWMSRTGRSVLALLLTAVFTAGCGGAAAPTAPLTRYLDIDELISAVAEQQRADRTARFSLRGELIDPRGARTRFTGAGALRVTDTAVEVQFTQVVTPPDGVPQETGFVVLSDAVYLRMPVPPGAKPERPWVRVDPNDPAPESRRLLGLADSITQRADPTGTLARYPGATQVAEAADDVVDGAPAVRYTLVTDLARAAEAAADPAVQEQLEQQVRDGLTSVTSMLWVDAEHRLLRNSARQELPGVGSLSVTGYYRDWGQDARIEPPAADTVQ